MKKYLPKFLWALFVIAIFAAIFWLVSLPKVADSEFVSKNGLHWHAELHIKVKGEEVPIPAGIGLGAVHNPIHIHDADNVVHMEFSDSVRKEDLVLKNFFKVWGKDFSRESVLGNKTGEGGIVKMFVSGRENSEFENYLMQDGDKIEITYE